MDPQQPTDPKPPVVDPNAPVGYAAKYTRQQWLDMKSKAVAAGDLDSAKVFEQMASEWKTPAGASTDTDADMAELERRDYLSLGNILGSAIEPNLTMLSGGPATVAAGLAGIGKGVAWNPAARALGGHPNDAADLVRSVQSGLTWQPQTAGGERALGAIGAPWQAVHEHISDPSGHAVEEGLARAGAGTGTAAALGTLAEVVPDAVSQLFGGELLGRTGAGVNRVRNYAADYARDTNFPKVESAVRPKPPTPPNKDVVELNRAGVTTTMGQRWSQEKGSGWRQLGRLEELMRRNPFWGAHIRKAHELSVEQMNFGQLNDARIPMGLKPIRHGELSPEDAIIRTEDDLQDKYDALLPRLQGDAHMPLDASPMSEGVRNWTRIEGAEAKFMADKYGWPGAVEHEITPAERLQVRTQLGIAPDAPVIDPNTATSPSIAPGTSPSFIGQMSDILTTARDGKKGKSEFIRLTSEEDKTTLANLIDAIIGRMSEREVSPTGRTVGGMFDGYDIQTISKWISAAKQQARKAQQAGSLSGQLLPYLERLQDTFRDMINASNPGSAAELRKHQMAWSQLKLVEDMFTARGGDVKPYFSPAAGTAAVRRKALAKPEGRTLLAKGQAQGQKLAGAAERVLGNKVRGDSPTAEALVAMGETGADVLTGGVDPVTGLMGTAAQYVLGNMLGQYFLYRPGFQKWLQNNYLRGHANVPFTPFSAGGTFARGLPTAIGGEERSRETMNDRMRQQLMELGVNPDMAK